MRGTAWLLLAVLYCGSALAQDYAREQRWADEVAPGVVVGDAVYLTQRGGHRFLALYTASPDAKAGVVVVHGMGVHPDWNLIGALRTGLAEQGYATLSVQMPVLAADAKGEQYPALFDDAAERLRLALQRLHDKGYGRVAIVSHSMGSRMVDYFLAHGGAGEVQAWAAVSLSSGTFESPAAFRAPVLDIYAANDLPAVRDQAAARAAAIRTLRGSSQVRVADTDHFFNGREVELTRQVRQFLDSVMRQPP